MLSEFLVYDNKLKKYSNSISLRPRFRNMIITHTYVRTSTKVRSASESLQSRQLPCAFLDRWYLHQLFVVVVISFTVWLLFFFALALRIWWVRHPPTIYSIYRQVYVVACYNNKFRLSAINSAESQIFHFVYSSSDSQNQFKQNSTWFCVGTILCPIVLRWELS